MSLINTLEVMLDKSLSWSSHITYVASKATRMLNFLNATLVAKCSTATKASAYLLLVRPLMEYHVRYGTLTICHIYQYWRRHKEELPDGLYLIIVTVVVYVLCYTTLIGHP